MTDDDLRAAIIERMRRPESPAFRPDPDKERRGAALDRLRETDPAGYDHPHLHTERTLIANYRYRKALAEGSEQ